MGVIDGGRYAGIKSEYAQMGVFTGGL